MRRGRFFESPPLGARPHETEDTGRGELRGGPSHELEQTERTPLTKAVPLRDCPLVRRSPMHEGAEEMVAGLVLCEGHALEVKLEGQIKPTHRV